MSGLVSARARPAPLLMSGDRPIGGRTRDHGAGDRAGRPCRDRGPVRRRGEDRVRATSPTTAAGSTWPSRTPIRVVSIGRMQDDAQRDRAVRRQHRRPREPREAAIVEQVGTITGSTGLEAGGPVHRSGHQAGEEGPMSTDNALQSHVLRRELHSPKSGLAITLAVLAIVALAWIGTESVLAALGQPGAAAVARPRWRAGVRGLPSVAARRAHRLGRRARADRAAARHRVADRGSAWPAHHRRGRGRGSGERRGHRVPRWSAPRHRPPASAPTGRSPTSAAASATMRITPISGRADRPGGGGARRRGGGRRVRASTRRSGPG